MTRTRRTAPTCLAVAGLVLALGLSACGSDDDEETSTPSTPATTSAASTTTSAAPSSSGLARTELSAAADAICKTASDASKEIEAPASFDDPTTAAAYFNKIAPLTQTETDALAALEPDDEAKADFDAFIETQKAANELLKTITEKANNADASGMEDLAKIQPAGEAFAAAATKLGATGCAAG